MYGKDERVHLRILVIYAEWSRYDTEILSEIKRLPQIEDSIELIEVATIKMMSDFERHIPGIGEVFQTPAVGVWANETLVYKGTGFAARQYLRQLNDLDWCGCDCGHARLLHSNAEITEEQRVYRDC